MRRPVLQAIMDYCSADRKRAWKHICQIDRDCAVQEGEILKHRKELKRLLELKAKKINEYVSCGGTWK